MRLALVIVIICAAAAIVVTALGAHIYRWEYITWAALAATQATIQLWEERRP